MRTILFLIESGHYSLHTFQQDTHKLASGLCNACSRAEDSHNTGLVQEVIVLCRYYTAGAYHDVATPELLKFGNELRNKGLMSGGK